MRFVYHEKALQPTIKIEGETYSHIFKVRRFDAQKPLFFRNLKDEYLYTYKVVEIGKKDALCELVEAKHTPAKTSDLNIAWAVVEPKTVEKTLPFLNELGVRKIIFVYMKYSQRNFKLDFQKLKRVAINSCEQCGRGDLIEFELFNSLEHFLQNYNDIGVVDFCENRLGNVKNLPKTWLVGSEGGFAQEERERLEKFTTVGFECENTLRSESAVVAICSKLLI
ncbi:MAG: 16S rRNA (uracil(1498)-N(3))-methyltransferase [Campylobacteraceae bacterium]|jgi:16S rRNA (uracil1498-N3)-methyltransferase|nr:16S rRNA (uracil(1498)-N(3))-methyltransferase [Campylobacteraceae bacterium]